MSLASLKVYAVIVPLLCFLRSPAIAQDVINGLMHGALVYHGNYCGPGNKGIHPAPVDSLDEACMHHDACTTDGQIPACSCNEKLRTEATRIAQDPRVSEDERQAAEFTTQGVAALPCQ